MRTILVVDDDRAITKVLALRLAAEGLCSVAAHSPDEALRAARRHHPDLVLLDIELLHESGLDLHRRMLDDSELRSIPVAYCSGNDCDAHRRAARSLGAKAFFVKPYDAGLLIAWIQSHLVSRKPDAATA